MELVDGGTDGGWNWWMVRLMEGGTGGWCD